ncbi:MAG: nucleotidyl transferase AbiEii/AbiGii toxin family protein [Bacteroidales bacterium]|nr:nucleotidyl transferase AbiEii/AbiGii toxin family protein [Bacteroidales bacterium]
MIQPDTIRNFYPAELRDNAVFSKYLIKEYIQLMILDYLSATEYIRKIVFIGGTNLRLVKGIDRFSEDLDFDCKDLTNEGFIEMTNSVLLFLKRSGLNVVSRDRDANRLKAFRKSIYFPELLFEMGLSGHREERFMIKIERQDQLFAYEPLLINIRGCGFFFPFPVPPDEVLCSVKVSAMLDRQKGRDFYDAMFLLGQVKPDYGFLKMKCGVSDLAELKKKTAEMLTTIDLKVKTRDFEHLLFNKDNSKKILRISEFINEMKD